MVFSDKKILMLLNHISFLTKADVTDIKCE